MPTNDFLSSLLAQSNKNSVQPDDDDQQSMLDQLASQPVPSDVEQLAQTRTNQVLAPNPMDMQSDPSRPQLFPPTVYAQSVPVAQAMVAQKQQDELKRLNSLRDQVLAQRAAMKDQGAKDEDLPDVPSEITSLPKNPEGMAASLIERYGEEMGKIKPNDPLPSDDDTDEDEDEQEENKSNINKPDTGMYRKELAVAQAAIPEELQGPSQAEKDFLAARDKSNQLAGLMMMGKGAEQIGAALARRPNDKDYLNELQPFINKPVEDLMTQQKLNLEQLQENMMRYNYAKAKNADDPDSPISQFARDTLNNFAQSANIKLNIPKTMTYSDVEKFNPLVVKMIDAKGQRDSRIAYQSMLYAQKDQKYVDSQVQKMGDDLNPNKMRSGNFAKNQARIDAADRLSALALGPNGQYNNLNPSQMEQLAIDMNNMMTTGGGGSARSQVEALVPKTVIGDINKFKQWITNNPTGTDQQKFVKTMMNTVQEQKAVALDQVRGAQAQMLTKWQRLKKDHPDEYYNVLGGLNSGLTEDMLDQNGKYVPQSIKQTGGTNDMVKIKLPDGREGMIPKSNLDQAIKQGATLF